MGVRVNRKIVTGWTSCYSVNTALSFRIGALVPWFGSHDLVVALVVQQLYHNSMFLHCVTSFLNIESYVCSKASVPVKCVEILLSITCLTWTKLPTHQMLKMSASKNVKKIGRLKVAPGIEPGSTESESVVITTTLRNRLWKFLHTISSY